MFKFLRFAALFLSLFFFSNTYSQGNRVDSLKATFQKSNIPDTLKLRRIAIVRDTYYTAVDPEYYQLNELAGGIAYKNYKNKKQNSPEEQFKYTTWLGTYYAILGAAYLNKPDHEKGLPYFNKTVALHKEAGAFKDMYFAMISRSSLYTKMKQYEKAIPDIFSALKYFENHKQEVNPEDFAYAYYSLAYVYLKQEKFEKAIEYYNKAIASYREYDADNYLDFMVGKCHMRIAAAYFSMKNYPEAIAHSQKSLQLIKVLNDPSLEVENLCRIGLVYLEQSKFSEAEKMFNQALALQPKTNTMLVEESYFHAYLAMGKLYQRKNDLTKAASYSEKALSLSQSINDEFQLTDVSKQLYEISLARKDYKRALEMFQLQQKLGDASKIEASKNALAQQLLQYNFEKKELKLKLDSEKAAAAQKNWIIALSGLLLLILLGIYFYYRNNKQKQAIAGLEKTQIKQKLLITQMNPHFIFNSVQNIRNLIDRHKNDDAVKYLDQFSVLTRQILENSNENYISLEEEVAMITNYLSIQQLLYNHKFDYEIHVEDEIEADSIFLPPMLTQPYIENAIKHGLSNRNANGMIHVSFLLEDGKLFFEVTDNGKGFDASKPTPNHKSLAMTITRERLISYTKNQDFTVRVSNSEDENGNVTGAKVSFEIPYIYEN